MQTRDTSMSGTSYYSGDESESWGRMHRLDTISSEDLINELDVIVQEVEAVSESV